MIHKVSQLDQWPYIKHKIKSGGFSTSRYINISYAAKHWNREAEFLSKPEEYWPENLVEITLKMLDSISEIKTKFFTFRVTINYSFYVLSVDDEHTSVDKLINYHSSWHKLKKSMAWILKIHSVVFVTISS